MFMLTALRPIDNYSSPDSDLDMYPYNPVVDQEVFFNYDDPLLLSPVLRAVLLNDLAKIKELIDSGQSLNIADNNGNTGIHIAVFRKNEEMVKSLLELGINVNCKNFMGDTPLIFALKHSSTDSIVIQLVQYGSDVNMQNNMEDTALHWAIQNHMPNVVQLLLEKGANVNVQDGSLFTPLHQAATCNNLFAIHSLLYFDVDVNMLCHNGLTPFMYSLRDKSNWQISEALFEYYDDFPDVTTMGHTALQFAIHCQHPITLSLIKKSVYSSFKPTEGTIVLKYLMKMKEFDLFKSVLANISFTFYEHQYARVLFKLFNAHEILSSSWFDYFYALIEAGYTNFENINLDVDRMMVTFLKTLSFMKLDVNTRENLLWTFLTLGFKITSSEISHCYRLFGCGIEAEILYYCYKYNARDTIEPYALPFKYFVQLIKCRSNHDFKKLFEDDYVRYIRIVSSTYSNIEKRFPLSLHYFIHNVNGRNNRDYKFVLDDEEIKFLKKTFPKDPKIEEKLFYFGYNTVAQTRLVLYQSNANETGYSVDIALAATVPSLLELSRNATALHIKDYFHIKQPYQFFDVINNSNIPEDFKDILLFRKPVCVA